MQRNIQEIALVVQGLPPAHDAIGEYTGFLAQELSKNQCVRVLTSRDHPVEKIDRVEIETCFTLSGTGRFDGLLQSLIETTADAVVLQYNPFAWGNRGWAIDLVGVIRRLRKERADLTVATMFHERYPPRTEMRFRLMRLWQVPQYRGLCKVSDINFFSTGIWAEDEKRRRPHSHSFHLPVGANLPEVARNPKETRRKYGIQENALVLGVFGGAHVSKQLDWVREAIIAVSRLELGRPLVALHVGGETEAVSRQLTGTPLIQTGRLSPHDAALAISAMDILLNPLLDGTSTRRGSTIAGLQNAVAVATTSGFNTESIWTTPEASGVVLAPLGNLKKWIEAVCSLAINPDQQAIAGRMNRQLFEQYFDWSVIANSMLSQLAIVREQKRLSP